ncbi:Protein of unknown function [Pyronema omphalodes CBS 100304]|uniref:Extracellular membrane protein CFEM domain-containing protein n=1 Tax=Pyronema omphalodes (strain CBS 100304) TaxID=1076935 RepID=U4KVV9_PYROM|nr:Protein of unknown function [Pyronema omphalodes CBS 100304]
MYTSIISFAFLVTASLTCDLNPALAAAHYTSYPLYAQSCLSRAHALHNCDTHSKCADARFIQDACSCIKTACSDDMQQRVRVMVTGACEVFDANYQLDKE